MLSGIVAERRFFAVTAAVRRNGSGTVPGAFVEITANGITLRKRGFLMTAEYVCPMTPHGDCPSLKFGQVFARKERGAMPHAVGTVSARI